MKAFNLGKGRCVVSDSGHVWIARYRDLAPNRDTGEYGDLILYERHSIADSCLSDEDREMIADAPAFWAKHDIDAVRLDPKAATCHDCGRHYGSAHGFPDLVVPNDVWEEISPTGDEGGLLCPSCLCRRAYEKGIECTAVFKSGPFYAE